jgi:hypothetical protein
VTLDLAKIKAEAKWLLANPQFDERPATLAEFLGPEYLNIADFVRPRIRQELINIMGEKVSPNRPTKYNLAIISGAIGTGKTTIASIVLPYLCHWALCLTNPQAHFNLMAGTRIALMQMSTSESSAREIVFGDIEARIKHSPWFQKWRRDPNYKREIRFTDKDIWIIPGDSAETTFEGYNVLAGILDEADSHKITPKKDYAAAGYNVISNRITSRFEDKGFLLVIGQMKSANGFAARKFKEFKNRSDAYAVRLSIWESFGLDHYRDKKTGELKTFWYDTKRHQIAPTAELAKMLSGNTDNLLEIPELFLKDFMNNPEQALRDLAGIPPAVGDPFISLVHKIESGRDRWVANRSGLESPVRADNTLESWLKAPDSIKRVAHVDMATSPDGDALGLAMGHVRKLVRVDGELKPYITFDLLYRLKAPAGGEIFLGDIRRFLYDLRDHAGYRLKKITFDGWQSTDSLQQLQRQRFETELVSVDKDMLPYYDLRDALYEERIEFPPYMVYLNRGDTQLVEIAIKELMELVDMGRKIDHPDSGSKDVADAMAGVTYTLMGDRQYRKGVVNLDQYREQKAAGAENYRPSHQAYLGDRGLAAPIPPTLLPAFDPRRSPGAR